MERKDTEFETLHKLHVLFRCANIPTPDGEKVGTGVRISVSRVEIDGTRDELGCTEIICNESSPEFQTAIQIDYTLQDADDYEATLLSQIGEDGQEQSVASFYFNLTELITSKGQFVFKNTPALYKEPGYDDQGEIFLGVMAIGEKIVEEKTIEFSLQINNLPQKTQACFFLIHRQVSHGEFEVVYESEFQNPVV